MKEMESFIDFKNIKISIKKKEKTNLISAKIY